MDREAYPPLAVPQLLLGAPALQLIRRVIRPRTTHIYACSPWIGPDYAALFRSLADSGIRVSLLTSHYPELAALRHDQIALHVGPVHAKLFVASSNGDPHAGVRASENFTRRTIRELNVVTDNPDFVAQLMRAFKVLKDATT